MADPLVTCTLLTIPGREKWVMEALECFENQTYPRRELIVLDGPEIIGAKRNMAVSRARGDVICHWDDDDWSHPERIEFQVARLLSSKTKKGDPVELVGFDEMKFLDASNGDWWIYSFHNFGELGSDFDYVLGTSFCYWKKTWRLAPFNHELQIGEDFQFLLNRSKSIAPDPANDLMWARIHPTNTSRKLDHMNRPCWRRVNAA